MKVSDLKINWKQLFNLYSAAFANPQDQDTFLGQINLLQTVRRNWIFLNAEIATEKIECVIKNSPPNKAPGPDGLTPKFYSILSEDLNIILCSLFSHLLTDKAPTPICPSIARKG